MSIDVTLFGKLTTKLDFNDVLNLHLKNPIEDIVIPYDDYIATNIDQLKILADGRPALAIEKSDASETHLDNYTSTSSIMSSTSSTRDLVIDGESNISEHDENEGKSTDDVCSTLWLQLVSSMTKIDYKYV